LVTTLGMGVGFALVRAITPTVSKMVGGGPFYGLVNGALVGTLIGAMQWLILRWQVSRAGWWVLASALGSAVGFAPGQVAGQLVGVAVTGIALVWLLRQPAQETQ
jgi:ABC-type enterochelin transport system permease subunit